MVLLLPGAEQDDVTCSPLPGNLGEPQRRGIVHKPCHRTHTQRRIAGECRGSAAGDQGDQHQTQAVHPGGRVTPMQPERTADQPGGGLSQGFAAHLPTP